MASFEGGKHDAEANCGEETGGSEGQGKIFFVSKTDDLYKWGNRTGATKTDPGFFGQKKKKNLCLGKRRFFFFIEKMTTFYKALSFNKFFLFSKIIGSCERKVIEVH